MDKRKLILIATIILIIAIGAVIYLFIIRGEQIGTTSGTSGTTGSTSGSSVFGNNTSENGTPSSDISNGTSTQNNIQKSLPRIRQLTNVPTAGSITLIRQVDVIKERVKVKETQYFVRYMERATGHIFDIKTDSPAPLQISNTTIPKIYEATFTPDGNSIIARLLSNVNPDQIITYFATLKDKKAPIVSTSTNKTVADINAVAKAAVALKDVSEVYLSPDIKELSMSPSGAKILSLFYTEVGGKLSVSNPNGTGEKVALSHPLREWLVAMLSDSKAVITTKPSGLVNGFAYTLDLASGSLSKVMGEIAGLTVLPNKDGTAYIGAGAPGGVVKLFSYFPKEDKQTILPLATFPEKCVWANKENLVVYCAVPQSIPNSTYPDVWYQGRILSTDDIWKINISTGETNFISNLPQEAGQNIDAVNMKLSGDDTYLTFINKKDLTLWGLDLTKKN